MGMVSLVSTSVFLPNLGEVGKIVASGSISWLDMVGIALLKLNELLHSLGLDAKKSDKLSMSVLQWFLVLSACNSLIEKSKVINRGHTLMGEHVEDGAVVVLMLPNEGDLVVVDQGLVDVILLCLNSLNNSLDPISHVDVLALGSLLERVASLVN